MVVRQVMGRCLLSLVCLLSLDVCAKSLPNVPIPKEEIQLKKALEFFNHQQFTESVSVITPLIDGMQLVDLPNIMLAHQLMTLSYCEIKNIRTAEKHAQALADFDRNFKQTLKSSSTCKKWLKDFLAPLSQTSLSFNEKNQSSWLRGLAPLGIYQFDREHKAWGWSLLVSQVVGLGLGLSGYFLYKAEQNPDGTVPRGSQANTYRLMNWVGFGSAGLSYGLGTVNAYNSFPR